MRAGDLQLQLEVLEVDQLVHGLSGPHRVPDRGPAGHLLEPAEERNVGTLKRYREVWNYLPKVDRVIKVPPSMMGGSWMGSHITNDDLVKSSRLNEDFTATLEQKPGDNDQDAYVIKLVAKPDAAVVYGSLVVTIGADRIPRSIEYFDEKGELVRTMTFSDVKEFDGERIPSRFTVTPADKSGEFTEIIYVEMDFDVELDDSVFTLQSLKAQ